MHVTDGQPSASAEGISSELWNLDSLYTPGMVGFEQNSSSITEFDPTVIYHTDIQQMPSCALPNTMVRPSLSPEIRKPNTGSCILPSSIPLYSTQTSTSYIPPSSTNPLRKQQQPNQYVQHQQSKDEPDQLEIRCWNHNCDGRRFSSLGNYRRHLREKEGNAKIFRCQDCGRSFTRSTSRNSHRQLGTCRKTIPELQSQYPVVISDSLMPWSDIPVAVCHSVGHISSPSERYVLSPVGHKFHVL